MILRAERAKLEAEICRTAIAMTGIADPLESDEIQTDPSTLLKIGEVAVQSGLPVKTVRYYDEIGLLAPTVKRSRSGYRLFQGQVLNRLAFIRRSQALGLSLAEVQQILQVHDQGQLPCGEVKQHLETKLEDVNRQIEALNILKAELQGILSGWQEQPGSDRIQQTICPNIQTF